MDKMRLDQFLVSAGYADSRSRAQRMITAGCVSVDGKVVGKSSYLCEQTALISVSDDICPYVSRGGWKLEKALMSFSVDPAGLVCIDSGASTGGFTDCLLQNGAEKVFAIDVGTDQLDKKLRRDNRVVVMEGTNIRYVKESDLGMKADLAVLDVSFISIKLVLPTVRDLLKPDGRILCLIKPQFEAGRENLGKKGVVKNPSVHRSVLDSFLDFATQIGLFVRGLTYSPVKGPEGNIEFLAYLSLENKQTVVVDTASVVRDAHNTLKG